MLYYARCDTHYLLYVYDLIRNELIDRSNPKDPQKNLIEFALQRSKDTSLDRYTAFHPDPATGEGARGWANSLLKASIRLDGPQFAVYRAVHKWRDNLARQEDENPTFIMPPQTLMEIARLLPSDPKALWSILGGKCAAKVQQSLDELFTLVSEAKKAGIDGPSSVEHFRKGMLEANSVAAVAKREFREESKAELDLPPVDELRSQKSQLFGSLPISSLWEGPSKTIQNVGTTLISLPWTTFVQEAAASAAEQEARAKSQRNDVDMIPLEDKPNPAPVAKVEPSVEDTEFTLRQGRKRKLEDVQVEQSESEDEGDAAIESQDMISLNVDTAKDERKAGKKAQKKAARAQKKAMKQAQRALKEQATAESKMVQNGDKDDKDDENDEDDEDDEEVPFDYSKAQSVLHAQRSTKTTKQDMNRPKRFDPYAARMNAEGPKPGRRVHLERSGKTATFKK